MKISYLQIRKMYITFLVTTNKREVFHIYYICIHLTINSIAEKSISFYNIDPSPVKWYLCIEKEREKYVTGKLSYPSPIPRVKESALAGRVRKYHIPYTKYGYEVGRWRARPQHNFYKFALLGKG